MTPTKEKITEKAKPLTAGERADIQQYFASILDGMKRHGLPDVVLLKKAFSLALTAHGGTRRMTGEPYIMHPLQVAKLLADCGHDSDMIAAAILHDTVKYCGVTKKELETEFGINIADIVDAVTSVSAMLAPDETMSKIDIDTMSDVKFLNESAKANKAVYIKCADRIHNLKTIGIFSEEQQKAKAYHTRNIIIPAAKKLHIHSFADTLGTLCLQIENPQQYNEICKVYADALRKNNDTLSGEYGLIEATRRVVLEDGRLGRFVAAFDFNERCIDSIHSDLSGKLSNTYSVEEVFTKDTVPLYDVFFISSNMYRESPDSLFLSFYDRLHHSIYKLTIIGHHLDEYETYYIMKDRFGNKYRLFVMSETEHMVYTHGLLASTERNEPDSDLVYVNTAEPGAPEQKMITVFKKDGSPMVIAEGATVLDFAFASDPNAGICAKYAFLNGGTSQTPIYTRLKPGDKVEIVCDHNKHDQVNDIPHATVRWFEYLHTREATKALSRWLEKHMDSAVPSMLVYDSTDTEYEIDMASTVLDFAFVVGEQVGLHVKNAYINRSQTPAELDTTLRYGDKVRFEYDIEDEDIPVLTWLSIVKTKLAKERLIAHFNRKYNM